jgi:hypothetical protein
MRLLVTQFSSCCYLMSFWWLDSPSELKLPPCRGFEITLRHTTLGRAPQDECSACCRELYLTIHNIHKRATSMFPAGLEPTIPASEWPQTYALGRAATGIGNWNLLGLTTLLSVIANIAVIATRYGFDGPGIESRWGRDFPHPSRPAPGTTQPPVQREPRRSRGKAAGAWL